MPNWEEFEEKRKSWGFGGGYGGKFAYDRNRTRLNSLARVFAKTDRIITGRREISVKMASSSQNKVPAAAFSDGQNITINTDRIREVNEPIGLVRLSGYNYHELSHLLFTPRDMEWRKELHAKGLQMAFNILEDQRIETLFTAKFKPAAKYFTEIAVQTFLMNPKAHGTALFFTHGRRFLPLEVRTLTESLFEGDDRQKNRAKRIIDEYRLLPLTNSSDLLRAEILIAEFAKIMKDVQNDGHQMIKPDDACTSQEQGGTQDRRLAEDASEQSKEDTKEQDETEADGEDGSGFWEDVLPNEEDDENDGSASGEADEEDDEDGEDGDGDGDVSSDEDDDEGGDDADGANADGDDDGDASGDAGADHGDDDADGEDDGSSGDYSESGNGGDADVSGELQDLLDEVLSAIFDSEDVQNDILKINQAIAESSLELDAVSEPRTLRPATSVEIQTSMKIEEEIKRLTASLEPGWLYGADHGRLNVQRAIDAASSPWDDSEDLFDEWDEGREDEAGVEVFLDADLSGSMGINQQRLSSALWVLKRAFDRVDAEVSVAGFHETTKTLYQRGEKADPIQVAEFLCMGGGTVPANSMAIARRIMSQSQMPNRLFVILTDGAWQNEIDASEVGGEGVYADYNTLIPEIDAVKVFIGIGGTQNRYPELFDHNFSVRNIEEIPEKIKGVVNKMLADVVAGRR